MPFRCRVCNDPVKGRDWREHLSSHNPNAENFDAQEVRDMFWWADE